MAAKQEPGERDYHADAGRLLETVKVASLATLADGVPQVSLVTPALLADGVSVVLLLSDLSAHTAQLRACPDCALLFIGQAVGENPQTAPRVSLTGRAAPMAATEAAPVFLVAHPYAALYAGFADFGYWRVAVTAAHYVGGFAAAARLDVTRLRQSSNG